MSANSPVREAVMAFLEANPNSRLGAIQQHVIGLGLSTEKGVQQVIHSLVRQEALTVDRAKYNAFLYSVNEGTRIVRHLPANRFEVPAELAGPILPPMVWSVRHLLGVA